MQTSNSLGIDPVTFEILYHRLLSISEEMGIHYMRCSGSNVLHTGNDAASGIMLADGSLVAVGPYIVTQGNVLPLIVESTLEQCTDSPGIEPGDVFICNDPYLGAIHQPDIATVAPVFHRDEMIGWVGASGHQLDTGGMDPGGFSVNAVEIHQEGLRMPPTKLVEGGELREDIFRMIVNHVRDPIVGLDIKGQLAALNAGRRKINQVMEQYGREDVLSVMEGSITHAREKLQQRLAALPDGRWKEVQYIDHDGHEPNIYRIVCEVTKEDDRLTFDFTGTSPQARGLINSTYSGLQAGVLSATYILLSWDLPWNHGVRDCVEIVSESGTVNNCESPAPCAMATISSVIVTIDAAWGALSRMMMADSELDRECMALWTGSSMAPIYSGTNQQGFPFASTEMSHFGGGGGARPDADGVDTGGIVFNTTPNMPNIEQQESEYPMLYLFRRHLEDSGGPGRRRGGRSGELAYTPYDNPEDDLEALFAGTGAYQPNALGLDGGYPGAAIRVMRKYNTDLVRRLEQGEPLPDRFEGIDGKTQLLEPKHGRTPVRPGDVWYHSWQGAGGFGDPLNRPPQDVARDVAHGAVSPEAAREIYGVKLDDSGAVDTRGTEKQRRRLREERLEGAKPATNGDIPRTFSGEGVLTVGESLEVDFEQNEVRCLRCGRVHGDTNQDLTEQLLEKRLPLEAAGPVRGQDYDRASFSLSMLMCPDCAEAYEVRVLQDGEEIRPSYRIG